MDYDLDRLLLALIDAWRREQRPGGDVAVQALLSARQTEIELEIGETAPLSLLEAAAEQQGAMPLAATVLECCQCFHWQHWAEGTLDAEVSANLYTTELVGPDGLVYDADARIGLLVSAADTDYPVSSHSGEETYLVISGVAEWTLDDGLYRSVPPGELVHHPAWKSHGRRTLDEVFLGAWRWSGDLDLASFRVDERGR